MDRRDSRKAPEVGHVEGKEVGDAVDAHRGDQASVMHLDAGNGVENKKPAPLLVDGGTIRQEGETTLKTAHSSISLGHRQAKASSGRDRAGANIPELTENLRRITDAVPACAEHSNRVTDETV
jgi:hypothetical protein